MKCPPPSEFTVIGDVYHFRWPLVEVELDRFVERKDDLTAELTVYSHDPTAPGLLYDARFNLMAGTTRKLIADMLERRMDFDWPGVLEAVCKLAKERWREGEPAVNLWDIAPQEARWLLKPYIEVNSPTVLFAVGGSGKSVLALAMAYTVAAGLRYFVGKTEGVAKPVLYLDWETSGAVHTERLRAIAAGRDAPDHPPIFYKRMTTSLVEAAGAIRKEIIKRKIELVIVDSLGYAGGAAPEEAATAIALFSAIRTFGTATLCIHHRRKGTGQKGGDPDSLFGSAYYYNSARHVWQLEGAKDENTDEIGMGLIHVKSNNGRLQPRHGYTAKFTNDANDVTASISFRYRENLADLGMGDLKDQILVELRGGALGAGELAENLDARETTVRSRLTELKRSGRIIHVAGNKWGLPAVNG